jgi:acyl carrier protein
MATIHTWLMEKIAELAGTDVEKIDPQEPVAFYGLDSVAAVSLSGELQDWLGRKVPPTLVYDCPSIESMVRYLSTDR